MCKDMHRPAGSNSRPTPEFTEKSDDGESFENLRLLVIDGSVDPFLLLEDRCLTPPCVSNYDAEIWSSDIACRDPHDEVWLGH